MIYITQQQKEEWKAKIAELEQHSPIDTFEDYTNFGKLNLYKELISKAIVLPVYKSLGEAMQNKDLDNPNGLIIKTTII